MDTWIRYKLLTLVNSNKDTWLTSVPNINPLLTPSEMKVNSQRRLMPILLLFLENSFHKVDFFLLHEPTKLESAFKVKLI